jgi:hypothetical protein
MFMDMDFPHPRQAARSGLQQADYAALVASATARQANSHTVSALLSMRCDAVVGTDMLGSRIAFFAKTGRYNAAVARGAFWMKESDQVPNMPNRTESPVNLADSVNSNSIQSDTVKPDVQVAERGTEL